MRSIAVRGAFGSLLILLSGIACSRVPRPSWVRQVDPLADLRASGWRISVGLGLALAGLTVLTWAWWDLRRYAAGQPAGVNRVRAMAALWSLPLLAAPPLFSGDGWSYVATGYLKGIGLSPYTFTPSILPPALSSGVNGRWLDTPSPYGPLALDWGGLAAHLTANPWLLLIAYRVLALVGLALVAWAAPRLARRAGRDPGTASWLLVASPFVMAQCVGGMHNDVVMAGLDLAALAVTRRGRWVAGAALIGLAAAIKIPAVSSAWAWCCFR